MSGLTEISLLLTSRKFRVPFTILERLNWKHDFKPEISYCGVIREVVQQYMGQITIFLDLVIVKYLLIEFQTISFFFIIYVSTVSTIVV